MTRTKRTRASSTSKNSTVAIKSEKEDGLDFRNCVLPAFDTEFDLELKQLDMKYNNTVRHVEMLHLKHNNLFTHEFLKRTYGDVKNNLPDSTFMSSASIIDHINQTKSIKINRNKKNDSDEGYVTTESNRTASCDRSSLTRGRKLSRAPTTTSKGTQRISRSLSRSKANRTVTIQMPSSTRSGKKTPLKKMIPTDTFGFVTPKVKPNTPLTVLRRPKQGEMAISMQGSPLLVSGIITESCANVNIPLNDGRVLSLQPNSGLRLSQLPDFDSDTRRQLLTLRDNLNKVVKLAGKSVK